MAAGLILSSVSVFCLTNREKESQLSVADSDIEVRSREGLS